MKKIDDEGFQQAKQNNWKKIKLIKSIEIIKIID